MKTFYISLHNKKGIVFFIAAFILTSAAFGQNVGIGTVAPLDKLTVLTAYDQYGITHTDGNIRISTYIGKGGGAWFGTQSNTRLHLYTNGNGTPNITFNPDFVTQVRGIEPRMEFYDETRAFDLSGDIRASYKTLQIAAYKADNILILPGNLVLQANETNSTGTYYAGNVGIGETAPTYKLTVRTASDNFGMIQSNGTVKVGTYVGGSGGWIATQSFSPLYFCTGLLNGNNSAQMTLLTNGNFGIGTLNPTYKLSVNGNIRSKEVVVETGWADYVFNENYQLNSLSEVEKFIQQNKHLPNMPSAMEIEEKGLPLGDTQKRMMEKIEELTLYMIEANKKIEKLEEMIKEKK